ncbi:glycosyltransferase family 9 protein [Chloroherpeton thalassium]|nr:glycosyltransferase family 9 protein [Chloroherpeton thalassium]
MSSSKKLLVISERGLGDALTLLPSLAALSGARPEINIQLLAPGLYSLSPNLRNFIELIDHKSLALLGSQEKAAWLRAQNFDWVWNTENQRSPWRPILQAAENPNWISALPHKKWPKKPVLDIRFQQLKMLFPELSGYVDFLLPLTAEQLVAKEAFLRTVSNTSQHVIAIQPGAADKNKTWPPEKFRELTHALIATGRVTVLFFIGKFEAETFTPEFLPAQKNLIRVQAPLGEVLPKLAACELFIGNDSGFYHLAHALGIKTVGIYSRRRSVKVWAYSARRSKAVWFPLPKPLRHHWKKMISVQRVLNAIASHLNGELHFQPRQLSKSH